MHLETSMTLIVQFIQCLISFLAWVSWHRELVWGTVPKFSQDCKICPFNWEVVMVALSHLKYSWSDDRMWRNNRRKGGRCDGVDLNRNCNSMWGGVSYPASFLIRLTPAITTFTVLRRVALVWSAVKLTMDPTWNLNQRHRTQSTISSELVIIT